MSLQIDTADRILLDGQETGLGVFQGRSGTLVYTPESLSRKVNHEAHKMPHARYCLVVDRPDNNLPGRLEFEADVRELLASLSLKASNS